MEIHPLHWRVKSSPELRSIYIFWKIRYEWVEFVDFVEISLNWFPNSFSKLIIVSWVGASVCEIDFIQLSGNAVDWKGVPFFRIKQHLLQFTPFKLNKELFRL